MKKTFTKVLSVFMAVLLSVSAFTLVCPSIASAKSAVSYPSREATDEDYARKKTYYTSESTMQEVIERLDGVLLGTDFANITGMPATLDTTISGIISDNLYNDDVITGMIKMIYPMICDMISQAIQDNANIVLWTWPWGGDVTIDLRDYADSIAKSLIDDFGIYIYPEDLANAIARIDSNRFWQVINAFRAAGTNWNNVSWDNLQWNINDRDSWVKGLGCVLSGLMPAMRAILQNVYYEHEEDALTVGTVDLEIWLEASANSGYNNSILPLLETLCGNLPVDYTYNGVRYTSLMSNADYCRISDPVGMAAHIAYPVFTMVENIAATAPVETVTNILPQLCYALYNNMLYSWLNGLQTKLTFKMKAYGNMVNKEIVKVDIPLNVWDLTSDMFSGVNIRSFSGIANFVLGKTGLNISLPEADTRYLADLGTVSTFPSGRTRIVADKPGTLLYLLRYFGQMCQNTEAVNSMLALFSGGAEIPVMLSDAIAAIAADPDEAICAVVELCCPQKYEMSELFNNTDTVPVQSVVYSSYWSKANAEVVSADFDGFLNTALSSLSGQTVGDLLRTGIGSTLFTKSLLNTVIISVRGVLSGLSQPLELLHIDLSSWDVITEDYNWGFTDGDKAGFTNALISALSPFNSLLKMLFANSDVYIMNGNFTVLGYEGYAYGVIPLLEAVGCRANDIASPSQYATDVAADESAILRDILVPVLNLLERLYNEPVGTALEILPNILYFIGTGTFELALKNTLQSIFVLLDNVRPIINLGITFDFSFEGIVELISSGISGNSTGDFISELLTTLDITPVLQGSVQTATSKNGTVRKYISGSNADTLTAVLRTAIGLMFAGDNEEAVELLLMRILPADTSVRGIVSSVISGLDTMYNETDGTDKILSLIYYIYNMGGGLLNGDFSAVAELLNRWSYVVETLESEDNEYLVTFLDSVLGSIKNPSCNATDTQSTNLDGTYYASSTLALRGVKNAQSFADTLTKYNPSSFTNIYSLTHQTATDCTAELYADGETDVNETALSVSAALNSYSGNLTAFTVSLVSPEAENLLSGGDTVTLTSANGKQLTYSLNEQGNLIGNTVPAAGEKVGFTALRTITGAMPEAGDSVKLRVVLTSTLTGADGNSYTNASYADITLYSVDKSDLQSTLGVYTAPEAAYTESYSAYSEALTQAKAVLADTTAKQTAINESKTALETARTGLSYSENITAAVNTTSQLLPVTGANYLEVKTALNTASKAISDSGAAVELCDGAVITDYKTAKKAYSDYINTLGADVFTPAEISYPERTPLANDAARTAFETYQTDETSFAVLLEKLDAILASPDFATLTGLKTALGDTVSELIENAICNDTVVTALVKGLYPTVNSLITGAINSAASVELFGKAVDLSGLLGDIARDMLGKYSLALYPDDLADVLQKSDAVRYSANIRALRNAGNEWSNVNFNSFTWGVYDMDSFIKAMGASLSGVQPVITALLTNSDYSHSDTVYSLLSLADLELTLEATACSGYDGLILPLLEMFCKNSVSYSYNGVQYNSLMTPTDFNSLTDISDMLAHIVYPLLSSLETALNTAPVAYIMSVLPDIAAFFRYDLGSDLLGSLSTVVGFEVSVDVYGSLISQKMELSVPAFLSEYTDIDLSDLNGLLKKLTDAMNISEPLPTVNVNKLASMGSVKQTASLTSRGTRGSIEANSAAVLASVISYAASALGNTGLVTAVGTAFGFDIADNETVSAVLGKLRENPDGIVSALNELVVPSSGYAVKKIFTSTAPLKTVAYTQYFTKANAKDVAGNIDSFINQITTLFGMEPLGTILENKLSGGLYTNANLTSAVLALRGLLGSIDANGTLLPVLGIDISSWVAVEEGHDWGFADGNKNGFVSASVNALSPLNGVLECLLANGDYYLINYNIRVKGSSGYKDGVIPVLEALGCENIITGSQYSSDIRTNSTALLTDILNPVLALLEKVYASPIETVLDILPNVAYFIESGAADNALQNILHGAYVLLDTVRPLYDVELNIELSELIDTLISENLGELLSRYGIVLPDDFGVDIFVAGTTGQRTSLAGIEKRTALVESRENTLTVLLREIVDLLFYGNNANGVKNFILMQESMKPELQQLVVAVIDGLGDVHAQPDGTNKVLGIIYKLYSIGGTYFATGSAADTVLDNWKTIVKMFVSADESYITDFIGSIYGELCEYVKVETGTDIEEVVPEETVTLLMKIKAFFRKIIDFIKGLFIR